MSTSINQHRVTAVVVESARKVVTGDWVVYVRTFKFKRSGETVLEVTAFADSEDSLHLYDADDNLVEHT